MRARVSTLEGPSEQVVPALEQMDGYVGTSSLADRRCGRALAVVLWESAEAAGDMIASVEEYEVLFSEM